MNKCQVRIIGSLKEVLKFMVDNMEFVEVDDNGVKFINVMNFGKTMKESDELFMKDQYGVKPYTPCLKMKVIVYNNEFKLYYDDDGEYYENPPKNLYEFRVENHGAFYDMYKTYEKNVCFQDEFVTRPKEFMSEFFGYFTQPNIFSQHEKKDLQHKMKLEACIDFEFETYDFPLELLNLWYDYYNLSIKSNWADENEFLIYTRYQEEKNDNMKEEDYINRVNAEQDLQRYTQLLLTHKWANLYNMITDICDMLYDMKDSFPVKLNLEYKDQDPNKVAHMNNKYKYNALYSNISSTVHSLANSEAFVLARIYAGIDKMHKEFMNKNN
jgi:hypothetical protein